MGASATSFHKYEGLGNDFIVVDATDERIVIPECAAAWCDRRFGVGADGVLLVLPARADGCDVRMRVINADGSVPEMCGNGVRCVALHVARGRGLRQAKIRVETDAGPCACDVDDVRGDGMVTVDMGVIHVYGDRAVDVDGKRVLVTVADAGNPHAVLFGAFARGEVEHLGPRVATHPDFPRGTNVEFARVAADGIDLVVWERGVGITLACGTGACATAAVACDKGLTSRDAPIAVRLPGGRLTVTIDAASRATMCGPARHVFDGAVAGLA
ncbi:MAG TPA: diaminopimelate epimerase [Polyangiaceae bacterium]|nr:diaminopimelate epimerase [Polyangiaceae bacterium]